MKQFNLEDMLIEFQQGCPKAFQHIYTLFYKSIFDYTLSIVGQKEDAEDITADTFIKLNNRRSNYLDIQIIRAFLFITARNGSLDCLRSRTRRNGHHKKIKYLADFTQTPPTLDNSLFSELVDEIPHQMKRLTRRERQVTQFFLDEYSNREVSVILGVSLKWAQNCRIIACNKIRVGLSKRIQKLPV